jgi:hypothetical protein
MRPRPSFLVWVLIVLGALALRVADAPVVHAPERSPVETPER